MKVESLTPNCRRILVHENLLSHLRCGMEIPVRIGVYTATHLVKVVVCHCTCVLPHLRCGMEILVRLSVYTAAVTELTTLQSGRAS